MNAIEKLKTIHAERDAINMQIAAEEQSTSNCRARREALESELADLDGALAVAKNLLADAYGRTPSGDSDEVKQCRADMLALLKQREKLLDAELVIEALRKAEHDSMERCKPLAERLMEIARAEAEIARQRLDEYGQELFAELSAVAQKLADIFAKGNAMNIIAMERNLPTKYAPVEQPLTIIMPGVGGGERVVIDYSAAAQAHREAVADRLRAEGFESFI